jgi:hypothetical protein
MINKFLKMNILKNTILLFLINIDINIWDNHMRFCEVKFENRYNVYRRSYIMENWI